MCMMHKRIYMYYMCKHAYHLQQRKWSEMARALRLGLTLSEEDAKVFWQSEEAYAVTPQQKLQLKEAQRIYQSHPIKF